MSERASQIQRVSKLLRDGLNIALHGAPQTGKSWVTDAVILDLSDTAMPIVRFDMSLARNGADAFANVASELKIKGKARGDVYDEWRQLRSGLAERTAPVRLVLDEFDAVVNYDDCQDFLRLLRELVHRPAVTHCSALIVSRRSLEAIESEVRGISTLATICVPECARTIELPDLKAGWQEAADLPEDDLTECLAWSAGHPPLIRYWLSVRPDQVDDPHGEHCQVVEFQRLAEHLAKARLGDAAAQLILGPVVDDWFLQARQLEMLGIIGRDVSTSLLAEHVIFRECLRQRSLDMNPWGVLGAVEVALRV